MRWDYDPDRRDWFSQGVHRDIVIVPHATDVEPNPNGGPPIITYKVPQYVWDDDEEVWKPRRNNGEILKQAVPWVITNETIVKEKFKFSHSLNSDDNLTFSSCNAAMVQFTIRNNKEYVQHPTTHQWYWEQEIPNLQNYEVVMTDSSNPESSTRKIMGELEGNACIKVYMYFNNDSRSLMYYGMYKVEEDKAVDNGYNRQITAYDFLAWFRDIDIFNWYKHLFTGINKLDNDYEDMTNNTGEEGQTKPDNYDDDENWIRKPASELFEDGCWTIGLALQDLINNFAAYDPIVYDDDGNPQVGCTMTNMSEYSREYEEDNGYSGLGMPIALDPDIITPGVMPNTPTAPGEGVYECYGYMQGLEIPFMPDDKIMQQESLSAGKFLEDIGLMVGRYPFIRLDKFINEDYIDYPAEPDPENPYQNRYQNYERCILSFKPLATANNDGELGKVPEVTLTNEDIAKGFKHDYYTVNDVLVFKIPLYDGTNIEYKRLNKAQRKDYNSGLLQTYTMPNNMFASYLVTKSDDDDIKKKLEDYEEIREIIFGKETKNHNMSSDALFYEGFLNMKHAVYTPYQLQTFCDPCRECGDRIIINYLDVITGEKSSFYTYILERSIDGIQKMMDTYTAKGEMNSPVFSNYQTGTKYQSGSNYSTQTAGYNPTTGGSSDSGSSTTGITASDLVQYWRNVGIRLLDEPTDCMAKFVQGSGSSE